MLNVTGSDKVLDNKAFCLNREPKYWCEKENSAEFCKTSNNKNYCFEKWVVPSPEKGLIVKSRLGKVGLYLSDMGSHYIFNATEYVIRRSFEKQ